jgi:hypothetical protein
MKWIKFLIISAFTFALSGGGAFAQGDDGDGDLPLTMTLMPENAQQPDAVTREIELPRDAEGEFRASVEGVENSAAGLEIANAARADGRAFGEAAAEAAESNRAAAEDNRGDFGRGTMPNLGDLVPSQVPDAVPASPPGRP